VLAGEEPPTASTRHMPRTRATRRPPRRPTRPAAAPPPRQRSGNVARNLLALIVLLLLAAVVAGVVVLATSDTGDRTNIEDIVRDDVNDQLDALRDLVEDNATQ
jgi:hypothetical protein